MWKTANLVSKVVISYPPLEEQKAIVAKLDTAFTEIDKVITAAQHNAENAEGLLRNYLANINAKKVVLENLVNIKTGKLDANAAIEGGEYPFFTCSRTIFAIDNYAFD